MGAAEPAQVRRLAMDYLARREHGSSELVDKLVQRGVESDVAVDTVAKLSQEGLQDDQRFAELYLRSQAARGKGPLYIRNGLRQRGLSGTLADSVLGAADTDWWALAEQVAVKKYRVGDDSSDHNNSKLRATQMRFLQQRGFTAEQSLEALKALNRLHKVE